MSQCVVPSWDLDDPAPNPPPNLAAIPHPSTALVPLLPFTTDNYGEVAELTWQNGQLALHGHSPPTAKWSKRRHHTGTLESLVNQATGAATNDLIDWATGSKAAAVSRRALVSSSGGPNALVPSRDAEVPAATGTGDMARRKRGGGVGVCSSQGSAVPPVPKLRVRNESIVEYSFGSRGVRDDIDITTTTANATATNSDFPDDGSGDGSPDMENTERDENDSGNHRRLQGKVIEFSF